MCYASRVMLRGRCSCAISERPAALLFAFSSLSRTLTPLFPLHTQKHGGGGCPNAAFASFASFTSSSSVLARTRRRETKGTLSAAPRATAAQQVVRPPMCTTESSSIVGAPTFLSLHTIGRSQKRSASERSPCTNFEPVSSFFSDPLLATSHSPLNLIIPVHPRYSPVSPIIPVHTQKQGVGGIFELSTFNSEPLFSHNSNHSRTYGKLARKSNYSRTYTKQGGGGRVSYW